MKFWTDQVFEKPCFCVQILLNTECFNKMHSVWCSAVLSLSHTVLNKGHTVMVLKMRNNKIADIKRV